MRDAPGARDVAFVVLLAGPGVPLGDILVEQNRLILAASGMPASFVTAESAMLRRLVEIAKTEQDAVVAATTMRTEFAAYAATLPEATRAPVTARIEQQVLPGGSTPVASPGSALRQMNSPWMRWMLAYDPLPALRRLKIPVLALFGERDLQVPSVQNKAPLESAVRAAGHSASYVVELPRLNHLFQSAQTGAPAEYSAIEETMSTTALELIGNWVLQQVSARTGGQ